MDKMVLSVPTDFVYDKRNDGWKLLTDVPFEGNSALELVKFLKKGELYVKGEVMLTRATKLRQMAGQRHAERMLGLASLPIGRVGQIPESWRAFVLIFPGTVWLDQDGSRCVPCLYWRGDGWDLRWRWLVIGWDGNDRFIRLCKPST